MKQTRRKTIGNTGFTMIEIIVVLLIIVIIAAAVVSRIGDTGSYNLPSQVDAVKTQIRYAQTRAMNSSQVWGINFSSSSAYSLFRNGDLANRVIIPGQDSEIVSLPGGISVTTGIVSFDSWGVPYTNNAGTAAQVSSRTISLSAGGVTENITITPNTGFIP